MRRRVGSCAPRSVPACFRLSLSQACVQDEDDIDAALLEYLGEEVFAECHAALRRLLLCQRSIASLRLAAV